MCDKNERRGHTRVQWAVAFIVNLSYFTYGLQVGWISPMIKTLQSADSPVGRPLSDTEISLIAGVPSLGAVFGILMLLYVVDTFGRKCALIVLNILQLMCWIIKLCPSNPTSLLVARIFSGLGAGGCFHVVPMYIKELSQDNIRGTLGSMGVLLQNLGVLIIYSLGGYLDYNTVLYCVVGVPVASILMLLKAPESPSFLVKIGKVEDAAATVAFLKGFHTKDTEVISEIDSIKKEDEYFTSMPNIMFFSIFKDKAWRRGFVIMIMVFIAHAMNGSFSLVNYASNVLADSGVKINPELQVLAVPIALMIGTVFTMATIDKLGRKKLLGTTFLVTSLSFSSLAALGVLRDHGLTTPGWLSVVNVLLIVCCYGIGVAPIPFIICSEIFNFQVRAKLMACLTILAWSLSFVQLLAFAAITSYLGAYVSFLIFGIFNIGGALTVFILLPETGGKSVSQIESALRREKDIIK